MRVWTWIIIILVVAMAIGPVMMLQPSAGMNRLAKMRTAASQLGLIVRVAKKGEFPVSGAIYSLPLSKEIRQKKIQENWCLKKLTHVHDIHFCDNWDWDGDGRAEKGVQALLGNELKQLPEGIYSLEFRASGLGMFWDEKCRGMDEQKAVEAIKARLHQISVVIEEN